LYSLDEGESGIVSLGLAIPDTTFLRKVDLERNTHAPVLGMDFSPKSNEVAYSSIFPKDTKRGFYYDVVGFDLENPANLTNWVVSEWNDTNPAFSSANPNMLAFVSDRSGVPQVWIKNSQTQKLFQVTDFQGSERINMGIAGLSWNGKNLFVNIQDVQGITRMVSIDVSSLL
jgi:Tol biopolymer transport system component